MLFSQKTCLLATAFVIATPSLVMAHPGHAVEGGFGSGWTHPFSGIDHLLAIIAIGLLAVRMGGRSLWAVPAAFLASGVLGGVVAWTGISLPWIEVMIIASVLAGGLLLTRRGNVPTLAGAAVALFGLFHGYAHLNEIASVGSVAGYSTGLLLASAVMLGGTILIAKAVGSYRSEETALSVSRVLGGALCAAAIMMLAQLS